ncbi:MAG TPA: MFS transporter [Pseudomonadales bacterium]
MAQALPHLTAQPHSVDVDALLDSGPLSALSLGVAVCAAVILILDGFDIQVIGFAAPALLVDFGVERSALAPALAASLGGMAVGAAGIGAFGDRCGRRPALILSTLVFGWSTLLAASATSIESLAWWRFVTGAGLGGALPTATALMAEYAPRQARPKAIGLALVGVPIGGIVGATLAAEIVPAYGWRALFVVGGVLPVAAAAVMFFVMPESPRFLATRGLEPNRLAALLNRVVGESRYTGEHRFVTSSATQMGRAAGARALFGAELRWDTLMTSLVFLTNIFAVYAFFNWAPLVLTSLGLDLATAVRGALAFNLAGVIGSVATAWCIAYLGSRGTLAGFALTAALAVGWLGWQALAARGPTHPPALPALMIGIALAGLAISAVQVGMYAVAAHVFPTGCRASGVGFALGSGRLGGILSAFAGGLLLAHGAAAGFFAGVASVLTLTFITVLLIRRHIDAPSTTDPAPGDRARRELPGARLR